MLLASCGWLHAEANSKRPNIIYILADDLGWTDTATYGSKYYETPNIDRLALQGLKLTQYHNCTNCQPTRAALMSGQYSPRTGIYTVGGIGRFDWQSRALRPVDNAAKLPLGKITFAQQLKKAGYATAIFGKWHLGEDAEHHPSKRGFEEAIVSMGVHYNFHTDPHTPCPKDMYLADFLTDCSEDFIRRHKDGPFFLYLPHFAVHVPIQAREDDKNHFSAKTPVGGHHNPTYAGMIYAVDRSVGRIMSLLDELKIADNTVLIFSSDNGGVGGYSRPDGMIRDPGHEGQTKGKGGRKTGNGYEAGYIGQFDDLTDNAPLRSGKGSLYEGGTRDPFIVRWPGVVKPDAICDAPTIHVDLYPTLLEIASAPRPDQVLDGESMVPLFKNPSAHLKRQAIYQHFPGYLGSGPGLWRTTPVGTIQVGDWKLMEYFEDHHLELYNLKDDIGEKNNLAGKMPDKAKELLGMMVSWRESVKAPMPTANNNITPPGNQKSRKAGSRRVKAETVDPLNPLTMDQKKQGELSSLEAPVGNLSLERGFATPPTEARLHAYWWWLNGNVTPEAITRDLVAMHEKGFGGALITDAGGANQDKNRQIPAGPIFGGKEWRELYRHALREGTRLNMEMALNIQSGWNLGGPRVVADDAAKILCWTETEIKGPGEKTVTLAAPPSRNGLLKEVAILAIPAISNNPQIKNWELKTLLRSVHGGNGPIAEELAPSPGGADQKGIDPGQLINLTGRMAADGKLIWSPPAGAWTILRLCYTVGPRAHVSTCTEGWEGLAIDPMEASAFQRYWDDVMEPLISDAKAIPNCTLHYLHTDSWEIEPYNWTARLPEEFRKRRGYDMTPWLLVLAKKTLLNVEASERFLHDFRKTVAELTAENYYGPFLANAHRHGMEVRAESGGPHGVPIDAQHCLGMIDVPMSEFWATSWRHRVPDDKRFFVKQPASAAHTYGKKIVAAEGFTTIGPHWQETVWDNLKPNFDRALCEGLNQLVWTLLACSPKEMGLPGQDMFAGTHFNPNSTWWRQSEGFLTYINRCQWMMRQGLFVADVLCYYGELAPNFAGLRVSNPAKLPNGHDYDVASEYVLLHRASVKDGRIVLPDGMNYGALVLPPHPNMSLAVLRKLRELAKAGAILIGPRPESTSGLMEWQKGDTEAKDLIDQLWGRDSKRGLVRHDTTADWLKSSKLAPDFEVVGSSNYSQSLDYMHRRDGGTDIYFVANRQKTTLRAECLFRVKGRNAELWNAVTGERFTPEQSILNDGRTSLALSLEPYGSVFVVFRNEAPNISNQKLVPSARAMTTVAELKGPWDLAFDPDWFYPDNGSAGNISLMTLLDWSQSSDNAIRYYSGPATYRMRFNVAPALTKKSLFLSLGQVKEMARVKLNGHDLGVVWCPPWNVRIPAGTLVENDNKLEIEVVNFWPNRLIGDAKLPPEQRRTKTNITKFEDPKGDTHYTTLMPSGLLGPVTLKTPFTL